VVGDAKANALLAIKRVPLAKAKRVRLDFVAPATAGDFDLVLFFMCDSYNGCDQVRTDGQTDGQPREIWAPPASNVAAGLCPPWPHFGLCQHIVLSVKP
jgi:Sec63 Brl domain